MVHTYDTYEESGIYNIKGRGTMGLNKVSYLQAPQYDKVMDFVTTSYIKPLLNSSIIDTKIWIAGLAVPGKNLFEMEMRILNYTKMLCTDPYI